MPHDALFVANQGVSEKKITSEKVGQPMNCAQCSAIVSGVYRSLVEVVACSFP